MHTTLDVLAELDPAPRSTPTNTAVRRRDAMLERVLAAPRTAPAPARNPTPGRTARGLVLGALVLAVAVPVAAGGARLIAHQLNPADHGLSSVDLASWVATSTPQTAAQLSSDAKQWCIDATDRQAGQHASVRILGGEERGSVASMLIERDGRLDICLANKAGGGGYWELVTGPHESLPAVDAHEVLLQSESEHGSNNVGTAWGQAGTDIRSVALHLHDREVEATVINGVWNAWWPDATSADFPTVATVTYTDGQTATVPVRTP